MNRLYPFYLLVWLVAVAVPGYTAEREAIFAGGCFWCMEEAFEQLDGVMKVESGYTGGHQTNPSYRQVVTGNTGHYEAVRIYYDDSIINYATLLQHFWRNVDPVDDGGQFCDRGSSYRTAIFYLNDEQKRLAQQSLAELESSGTLNKPIVTPLLLAAEFYVAEDDHQDYYRIHPIRYRYYKYGCGRPQRLKELWGES